MSKPSVTKNSAPPTLMPVGPALLIAVSAALCMLSVFQWMELRLLVAGGETVCGVSDSVNCATVWSSGFATRIHHAVGMPIAALGLVYSLTALALSVALVYRALAQKSFSHVIVALRLTAALGVLTCITMFVATLRIGAVCLTCIATYCLVVAFAVVALKLLPGALQPADADRKPAVILAGAFAVGAYLLLLYPGLQTRGPGESRPLPKMTSQPPQQNPHAGHDDHAGHNHPTAMAQNPPPLEEFLVSLPPMDRRALADALNTYRSSTVPPGAAQHRSRFRKGPVNAPIRIVDFVDIKCGHCRVLEETMKAISAAVPKDSFSIEPRYFPLDKECNKTAMHSDGSGTRCAAARAGICLEGSEFYWTAREQMFAQQETLTKEDVLEIASKGPLTRAQLESCIADPKTQATLDADIAHAMLYELQGTPLVLVNGREGSPMGAFLYAMILTGGNLSAPELQPLLRGN